MLRTARGSFLARPLKIRSICRFADKLQDHGRHDEMNRLEVSLAMFARVVPALSLLIFAQGLVPVAPFALAQDLSSTREKQPRTPVPRLSVSPQSLLADIDGNCGEDLRIDYSIDGDLTEVGKAWVEITDNDGKVVFTREVPMQRNGEVVWPQGHPMNSPTPNDITFYVTNPDGGISPPAEADAEHPLPAEDPTPVLSAIAPRRVVKGARGVSLIVHGRNFVPNAIVTLSKDPVTADIKLQPHFISSTELRVLLPASITASIEDWQVEVLENDVSNSEPVDLRVVPPGLPPAPVLSSISPDRLAPSENPRDRWITMDGMNFRKGDTRVLTDSIPGELEVRFISTGRLLAMVPAVWLSGTTRVKIHLESARDSDLASRTLVLVILKPGAKMPVIDPNLDSVNDGYVVIPPSRWARPTTVRLLGSGFLPNAVVMAEADGQQADLKTTYLSSHELRAVVPTDIWSVRSFRVTFNFTLNPGTAGVSAGTVRTVAAVR
jgi:hypothetical protein